MALFTSSKNPEKVLQGNLDVARSSRDKIAERLVQANRAVTEREITLQGLIRDAADDSLLILAERSLDEAERRTNSLQQGLVQAEVAVEKFETELAALLDAAVRKKTAAELMAMASAIEEDAASTVAAMAVLSDAVSRAAFISESSGLSTYASASLIQIPEAVGYTVGLLKERARLCIAGEGASSLPQAEAPFKPTIPVRPLNRRLFSVRPVSWTDGDDNLRTGQRYTDIDLPVDCARRALDAGAAVEMNNPVRNASTHNQWPGHPNPASCFNLDDPNTAAKADATDEQPREPAELHSAFQPLDRGKPYALGVTR